MKVITADHAEYSELVKMVNKNIEKLPYAVVQCASESDVVKALAYAKNSKKSIKVRGGRHSYNGLSTGDSESVIIDISHLDTIQINKDTVTVGGGSQLYYDIYEPLWKSKRKSIVGGSCPSVGIGGLASGGGFSFSGRKYGLTVDNIVEINIVLADGKVYKASPVQNEDLFWALCGAGGGNFGVITKLKIKTFDVQDVLTYYLSWEPSKFQSVYNNWINFLMNTPNEIMPFFKIGLKKESSPTLSSFGQVYDLSSFDLFDFIKKEFKTSPPDYFQSKKRTAIEAIQKWGGLNSNNIIKRKIDERFVIHNNDYVLSRKHSFYADSVMIKNNLTSEQILKIQKVVNETDVNGFILFDGHANGVSSKLPKDHNSYAHRDAIASVQVYSYWDDEKYKYESCNFVKKIVQIIRINNSGAYVNYSNSDNKNWYSDYYGENGKRLIKVKQKYDPINLFNHNQSIPLK